MACMEQNVFITEASGFLGRFILRGLLENYPDDIFYALARSEKATSELTGRFADAPDGRDR